MFKKTRLRFDDYEYVFVYSFGQKGKSVMDGNQSFFCPKIKISLLRFLPANDGSCHKERLNGKEANNINTAMPAHCYGKIEAMTLKCQYL